MAGDEDIVDWTLRRFRALAPSVDEGRLRRIEHEVRDDWGRQRVYVVSPREAERRRRARAAEKSAGVARRAGNGA